jgi:excinuclease ABC subunit A
MGGSIVATGTPEEVAENPASYTGQFLKKVLSSRNYINERLAAAE